MVEGKEFGQLAWSQTPRAYPGHTRGTPGAHPGLTDILKPDSKIYYYANKVYIYAASRGLKIIPIRLS